MKSPIPPSGSDQEPADSVTQRKTFLLLFFTATVTVTVLISIIAWNDYQNDLDILNIRQKGITAAFREMTVNSFREIRSDLLFLSEHAELRRFLATNGDRERRVLTAEYRLYGEKHGFFHQIRLIDQLGQEKARVDFVLGSGHEIPPDALISIADQKYFQDASRLPHHTIYVSRFELMHDGGTEGKRLQPILRFAAPAIDARGNHRGLVIFSFEGNKLLEDLRDEASRHSVAAMLLDAEGYWLLSPRPDDNWGFMFPDRHDRTLARRYPEAWRKICATEKGQVMIPEGLLTYETISLAEDAWGREPAPKHEIGTTVAGPTGRWIVASLVSRETLQAMRGHILLFYGAILGITLIILGPGCWFLATTRHHRDRISRDLRRSNEMLTTLIEASPLAIVTLDLHRRITLCNGSATGLFGKPRAELLNLPFTDLFNRDGTADYLMDRLLSGSSQGGAVLFARTASGKSRTYNVSAALLRDASDHTYGILALISDITDQHRAEQEVKRLAYFDQLTELPNRMLFIDRLNQAMAGALRNQRKVALIYLDLDSFKEVNDSLGHTAGDLLLRAVAGRLTGRLRRSDTVARIGGDEFVIILSDVADGTVPGQVAGEIGKAITTPFIIEGNQVSVSASIGIALFPDDGVTPEHLLKKADTAMYRAKACGPGAHSFARDIRDPDN